MIYNLKAAGKIPKDFINYQISLKLFENLKNDNVEPKKVLRN